MSAGRWAGSASWRAPLHNGNSLPEAHVGMAHTRWATHGAPTEANAHPHVDDAGRIALVHNGIIENYAALKQLLTDKGHKFSSQTDTERAGGADWDLYADLKSRNHLGNGSVLQRAVQMALHEVEGTYGIAVVCKDEPDTLVVARKGSPLIIGVGQQKIDRRSIAAAINVVSTASAAGDRLNDRDGVRRYRWSA